MKILTFASCYLPGYKGGGPIKTLKNLFCGTNSNSLKFDLVTSDRDLGDESAYSNVNVGAWNDLSHAQVFYSSNGLGGFKQIRDIVKNHNYDLIYLNSFFSFRYSIFPQILAKIYNKSVLVAPRGELSNGALEFSKLKKKLFLWLYKFTGLQKNTVFQASSFYEKHEIQFLLGKESDVFVAENIGSRSFAEKIPLKDTKKLRGVFLSRISPKKNLLKSLEVLTTVKIPVDYDIYGPIEDSLYWSECKDLIGRLPNHVSVNYKGELTPQKVINTLSKYDFFFFLTKGENFGHVIAEALCAGLPILISDRTPWRQLEEKGIGWDVPLNQPSVFSKVIEELFAISQQEHLDNRNVVLRWAKAKFSGTDVIEDNVRMFKYALQKK